MVQPALAEKKVILDFFYSGGCGSCLTKLLIIQGLEQNESYNTTVFFHYKNYAADSGDEAAIQEYQTVYEPMMLANHSVWLSFVVIKNVTDRTIITDITVENITRVLNTYIAGTPNAERSDETPGFVLILILSSIAFVLFMKRKRMS
jgi:thiol-disulfide isomerase/thioredoxin